MGLPSKKRTSGQRKRRASHFALKPIMLVKCQKCKKDILPHRACMYCGFYNGRSVISREPEPRQKKKTAEA